MTDLLHFIAEAETVNAIPVGLCQCGCGQATPLAPQSSQALGWTRGEPLRFVNGHNGKKGPSLNRDRRTCPVCDKTFRPRNRSQRACGGDCARQLTAAAKTGMPRSSRCGGIFFNRYAERWQVTTPGGGAVTFARALMECHLQRDLRPDEHVHHINGDKTDDRIENLQVLSALEHSRLHLQDRIDGLRRHHAERSVVA